MKNLIISICILFLPILCSAQGSMVAISASAKSTGMYGKGIYIQIENLESHEVFESKPLRSISESAVIENVPAGYYEVCYVEIPFGDRWYYNNSNNLRDYFGVFYILPDSSYYLGNFKATHRGKYSHRRVVFSFDGHTIPEKLAKFIQGRDLVLDDCIFLGPTEETFTLAEFSEWTNKIYVGGAHWTTGQIDLSF